MLAVVTLHDRPDLLEAALALGGVGAEFLQHDPVGSLARARLLRHRWPQHFAVVLEGDTAVARAVSIPFWMGGEGREELPDHGWDGILLWAAEDALHGRTPNCVAALDIQVDESRRGEGLSRQALAAMTEVAGRHGFTELVAPLRPAGKAAEPRTAMADYARRVRDDGLPEDPWLRVHVRAGAQIVKVAPFSMTVSATLGRWRSWTGLPFDADGPVDVEGGLAPVLVSQAADLGVYVEPNVWVRHRLS